MPISQTSQDAINLAQTHLARVQQAWDDPTDWGDLSMYGLYCLEAAIKAAHYHVTKVPLKRTHHDKAEVARFLHKHHSMPDIDQLLIDLNQTRKAIAYGDVPQPEGLNAQEIAAEIEAYVDSAISLLER
jgi:hypothetical protein